MASCWSQGWELQLYSAHAWYRRPLYQHLQVTSCAASLINKLRQDSGNDFTLGIGPARLNYSAIHSIREWNLESDPYITPHQQVGCPPNTTSFPRSNLQPPAGGWDGVELFLECQMTHLMWSVPAMSNFTEAAILTYHRHPGWYYSSIPPEAHYHQLLGEFCLVWCILAAPNTYQATELIHLISSLSQAVLIEDMSRYKQSEL